MAESAPWNVRLPSMKIVPCTTRVPGVPKVLPEPHAPVIWSRRTLPRLESRVVEPALSKRKEPTVEPVPHGFFGPGAALLYAALASVDPTVGFVSASGVELYVSAQMPEPVPLVGTPCVLQ